MATAAVSQPSTPEQVGESKIFSMNLVKKPAQPGSIGRAIKLYANHFRINIKPFTVHQYDVSLERSSGPPDPRGEKDSDLKNKAFVKLMFTNFMRDCLPPKYKGRIVYNFSKNMYSLEPLPFQESNTYQVKVEKQTYNLTLKKINQVLVDINICTDPKIIQIIDIVLNHRLALSCHTLNRSFFNPKNMEAFELGFGLQLWKGAYVSARPTESGLQWNLDTANAAFYKAQDLLEFALDFYNCPINQLKNAILNDKRGQIIGSDLTECLKGREIKVRTTGFRKKIHGFGFASSHKFELKGTDGKTVTITIKDYVKKQYNIDLKYPDLPCAHLGKETYVPIELCSTEPKNKKKLTDQETSTMIRHTAVRAPDRMNQILNWVKSNDVSKDPILSAYNIQVDLRMTQVQGRVMPGPDILYGGNSKMVQSNEIGEKGAWDHRNKQFVSPMNVVNWSVLNLAGPKFNDPLDKFIGMLINIGGRHGMKLQDPYDVNTYNPSRKNENVILNDLSRMIRDMNTKLNPMHLLLVVFSEGDASYRVVKTVGELQLGVVTQGVACKNLFKANDQFASNVLLKINTKLGGRNFILNQANQLFSQYLKPFFSAPIMIFGADVTHPAPGDIDAESIAAVTGSLDKDCTFYAARIFAQRAAKNQKKAQEIILDLDKAFVSLLNEFFARYKTFPKRIIFFRDGVSEGQFNKVLSEEINKMRAACTRISNGAYQPGITFIVVEKRHHTRLFPVNKQDENGRAGNVPPGTVVDTTITHPVLFDYYLCSHAGIQGTSRPCHYYVLHDDNNFNMNQMQLLTHYLCHVYSRCPRSVSYPAPAYYSHLAAFRGREYIRQPMPQSTGQALSTEIELHANIRNKMFFT